jgi:DNA processing protein
LEELLTLHQLWFHDLKLSNNIKIEILNAQISPSEFFSYTISDYISAGINMIKAEEISKSKNIDKYYPILEYLIANEIEFITYSNQKYPDCMRTIPNPPYGLFIKGILPFIQNSIAIIGARRASEYGKTVAFKFAYELSLRGITVVSGMARGIDSCAHTGAIEAKANTIAVMGSGFKNIYPKENVQLYERILNNGCAITEYMPDCLPYPSNFPLRNRIISAFSKYVLVVEAGERSGSLTTATLALEQGKDVFAVPGNIFSPNSIGTNKLIKDGAKIIMNINDILEEFNIEATEIKSKTKLLNPLEQNVIKLLKNGAISLECIIDKIQESAENILATLGKLECNGLIKRVYGHYYIAL